MRYYKLNHDGTLIRVENDQQQKYMPDRGWVHTRILDQYPHTEIKQATAEKKIRAIQKSRQ